MLINLTKIQNIVQETIDYARALNLLEDSVGKEVELGLSRGSSVKGVVTAFDQKYAKIAVRVRENNRTKTVIVRLGCARAFFSLSCPCVRVCVCACSVYLRLSHGRALSQFCARANTRLD